MKKSNAFKSAGITGILTIVSLILGVVASFNLPSTVSMEVGTASAFEKICYYMSGVTEVLTVFFLVITVVLLIVGFVQKKKNK